MTNPATNFDEMARFETETGVWAFLGELGAISELTLSSSCGISSDESAVNGLDFINAAGINGIKWAQATGRSI